MCFVCAVFVERVCVLLIVVCCVLFGVCGLLIRLLCVVCRLLRVACYCNVACWLLRIVVFVV